MGLAPSSNIITLTGFFKASPFRMTLEIEKSDLMRGRIFYIRRCLWDFLVTFLVDGDRGCATASAVIRADCLDVESV